MARTRRSVVKLLVAGVAALGIWQSLGVQLAAEQPSLPTTRLAIETSLGRFDFVVEIADTPSTWQRGLQQRRQLAADAGMLFNFHQPRVTSMWMKDTVISLDMIFIDEWGAVVNVAERTLPLSTSAISSNGPVMAVLEVNAGTAARLGIRPGDRVRHPMFSAPSRRAAPN